MITRLFIATAIVIGYSAPIYAGVTPSYEIDACKIVGGRLKQRTERQILPMHFAPPGGDVSGTIASSDPLSTPVGPSAP